MEIKKAGYNNRLPPTGSPGKISQSRVGSRNAQPVAVAPADLLSTEPINTSYTNSDGTMRTALTVAELKLQMSEKIKRRGEHMTSTNTAMEHPVLKKLKQVKKAVIKVKIYHSFV